MPNNNNRHLKWYLKDRFSVPKHYMGRDWCFCCCYTQMNKHWCLLRIVSTDTGCKCWSVYYYQLLRQIWQLWFQILLYHLLNSSTACINMFHASNLSNQILWAQLASLPAVTNIRSTLTTRQRRWQNPTLSWPHWCSNVKAMCDVTRITHDSLRFSSFPLPPWQKRTSGGGTVRDSGQCHMFFSQLAASLNDQYKAHGYT